MNCFNCNFAINKGSEKCVCSLMKKIVNSYQVHPRCPLNNTNFKEDKGMNDKEKQIEEMAKIIVDKDKIWELSSCNKCDKEKCNFLCYKYCGISGHCSILYSAGYRKANDVLERADDLLHDLAMEYAERGYMDYFCVCENVHHKVIAKLIAEMRQEVEE